MIIQAIPHMTRSSPLGPVGGISCCSCSGAGDVFICASSCWSLLSNRCIISTWRKQGGDGWRIGYYVRAVRVVLVRWDHDFIPGFACSMVISCYFIIFDSSTHVFFFFPHYTPLYGCSCCSREKIRLGFHDVTRNMSFDAVRHSLLHTRQTTTQGNTQYQLTVNICVNRHCWICGKSRQAMFWWLANLEHFDIWICSKMWVGTQFMVV
jgi:hypothetical protein